MDERLSRACSGASQSQGGLNVSDLKLLAKARGYKGPTTRRELLDFLCSRVPAAAAVPMPAAAAAAPVAVPAQLSTAYANACKGLTASQGGMNVSDMFSIAKQNGYTGPKTRDALCAFFKGAPRSVMATKSEYAKIKLPKLPRGQVGINSGQWATRRPNTVKERRELHARCGDKCFLVPEDGLRYPICSKAGNCNTDCDGLRSHLRFIKMNEHRGVSDEARARGILAHRRAHAVGKRDCGWQ